eukprot:2230140-Amphidinium_carterae.1
MLRSNAHLELASSSLPRGVTATALKVQKIFGVIHHFPYLARIWFRKGGRGSRRGCLQRSILVINCKVSSADKHLSLIVSCVWP